MKIGNPQDHAYELVSMYCIVYFCCLCVVHVQGHIQLEEGVIGVQSLCNFIVNETPNNRALHFDNPLAYSTLYALLVSRVICLDVLPLLYYGFHMTDDFIFILLLHLHMTHVCFTVIF